MGQGVEVIACEEEMFKCLSAEWCCLLLSLCCDCWLLALSWLLDGWEVVDERLNR
jgi:hypothetical protein